MVSVRGRLSSVLSLVAAAARALAWWRRPPPDRPFVPPFVGEYRTRPVVPPPPPEPAAPPKPRSPRPRHGTVGLLLVSLVFVVIGVVVALAPHRPSDRLWGQCSAGFFGLCAWVFAEQLLAERAEKQLSPGALRRTLVVLFLNGAGGVYLAWTCQGARLADRLLIALFGAAFLVLSLWAGIAGYRNGRLLGGAPRARPRRSPRK